MKRTKEKGITLIALIITIIVMLILVAVTVNVVIEGGLISTAQKASNSMKIEKDKEILYSAAIGSIEGNACVNFSKLDANLPEGFEGSNGIYKKNDVTYRVDAYGTVTTAEFSTILAAVQENPEEYLAKAALLGQDTEADKNIGIGTDGNIVNLGLWTYEVVDGQTITLKGNRQNPSYGGQIINGKIEGTVPQYIYLNELNKIAEVTSIGICSFFNYSELTEITLPDTITTIGNLAFSNCSSLKSIVIPNGVTSIGAQAFTNCSSLETIAFPNTITSIGQAATFQNCVSLKEINIPEGVTSIGTNTFYKCTSLKKITIPNSVTRIQACFTGCTSLELIEIDNTENAITGSPWGNGINPKVVWLRES